MVFPLSSCVFLSLIIHGFLAVASAESDQVDRRSFGSSIESGVSSVTSSLEGDFNTFKNKVESEVSSLLVGSNGTLAQFSMGVETVPPINARLRSSGVQSNVTVGLYCSTCNGASQPPAFSFASGYSGWNQSWLGFALDSFEALFEVEIDLSATANGDISISLYKVLVGADGVIVEVEFLLYLVADASASMSFITGLNLTLNKSAAIMMPALDPVVNLTLAERVGFDPSDLSLTPIFNSSMPNLDFSIRLSLRTAFSVTVEDINIGALYLDLPAFNISVNTVQDKTSDCQTPPAGTPLDKIYSELVNVNGALVAELSYELFNGDIANIIDTWNIWTAFDQCYAFFPGLGFLGPVPASSNSPLLTAAAITTCANGSMITGGGTIGAALRSLSPGGKAGTVIGALLGVALFTALGWFGGRASLNRNNIGGNGSSWTMPRPAYRIFAWSVPRRDSKVFSWSIPSPRFGKFFSREKKTEFSPVTPTTPNWQSTAYEGVMFESPNIGMQQQYPKKESNVAVEEVTSPAPTYVSMGDDHAITSPTAWQSESTRGASHLGNWGGDTMRALATPRTGEVETIVSNARSQEPSFEAVRQPGERSSAPIPEPPSVSVNSASQPALTGYGITPTTQPRPQYRAAPEQHFQQAPPMKYNEAPPQLQDQFFRQQDTNGDAWQTTITTHTPKQHKWSFNRMVTRPQTRIEVRN